MNDSCYINNKCYSEGETSTDGNCLQCQPNRNQTEWSFNPKCLAADVCPDPYLRAQYTCPPNTIAAFYNNSDSAMITFYDFTRCNQGSSDCPAGFFRQSDNRSYACCPGYFCPQGQVCMIPCRPGAYCPSPLPRVGPICSTPVVCPYRTPMKYDVQGCGGSTFEGFCPAGTSCANSSVSVRCSSGTSYCPTGVTEPLPCLTQFRCTSGEAREDDLFQRIPGLVGGVLIIYIFFTKVWQWLTLKKRWLSGQPLLDSTRTSSYFQKRNPLDNSPSAVELNIHLYKARLRDVTRFDATRNAGFTGRIKAGRITALMGGSGCGKSSLLDTIHGRRRLRDGSITFAQHAPLTNDLSDYTGYVPQADIMHDDLTVFETVYYSARARRLRASKKTIKQDVCFALNRLGLSHMHNSMTQTLSGGNRHAV